MEFSVSVMLTFFQRVMVYVFFEAIDLLDYVYWCLWFVFFRWLLFSCFSIVLKFHFWTACLLLISIILAVVALAILLQFEYLPFSADLIFFAFGGLQSRLFPSLFCFFLFSTVLFSLHQSSFLFLYSSFSSSLIVFSACGIVFILFFQQFSFCWI